MAQKIVRRPGKRDVYECTCGDPIEGSDAKVRIPGTITIAHAECVEVDPIH